MGLAGSHWTETGLGVPAGADYLAALAASASGEVIEAGVALPGGADRGWLIDDAPPLVDSFLSLDADTLFFEGDDTPVGFAEPAEEADDARPAGGDSSGAVAAEAEDLAGDLDLPGDAGSDAPAVLPDWLEPDFEFLSIGEADGEADAEADGVAGDAQAGAQAGAGTDPALAFEDVDLPGDVIPPPEEPEFVLPVGDVIPAPEGGETGPFTGDDGSVVALEDLPDAFEFLLL
ncbi:MAG TPA: hypothetical protein VMM55_06485 [Thermohalobaculum sp.]|nr:hypothetical protein [Thermohalobaculum sp.]